jgi:integrase
MATIRKRGTYQWQALVRRKGYPPQTKTFESRTDAVAWATELESEMNKGAFVSRAEAERTTLAEVLARYETEFSQKKKGAKQEAVRIRYWLRHKLSHRMLSTIRSADFSAWKLGEEKRKISPNTINKHLILLSHLFNVAHSDWGMESLRNPIKNMTRPKATKGRNRRLKKDEEKFLIKAAAMVYPMFDKVIVVEIETGMRRSEIATMQRKWLDKNLHILKIPDTKNSEKRDVPLSPRAMEALNALPVQLDGSIWPGIYADMITHKFKEACALGYNAYKEECEAKGVTPDPDFLHDLVFHDLRHEATSRLFELGFNIMEVAAITGHKTLIMLMRYTHLHAEDLAKKLRRPRKGH